jgi:hypothetical protein
VAEAEELPVDEAEPEDEVVVETAVALDEEELEL